ncbi:MAG: carboxylesterase/lipase family protein [Vicinamibacterales bacterium]
MKGMTQAVTLAITCAAAALMSSEVTHTQSGSCFVGTTAGSIQGLDRGLSCAFLGIRYAAAPTGSLRWTRPQPAAAWAPATFNATVPPPSCAQISAANGQPTGVEDCLMLNVWTPNPVPASGAPVIVWIHGGGFVNASANFASQNGQNLAALTGAVVVAPNYRLGPFGFLGHSALAGEDSAAGNYGLLDQRAALIWVRDHIASFGGDPNNVTLAGQSAGAHSVSLHLVAPGSSGLFHRAIMQSGSASFRVRDAADARQQGSEFATALGCTGSDAAAVLACLRSKTQNQVLTARPPSQFEEFNETGRTQWTPIVDGVEIPDQPRSRYHQGAFARVPVLLGTNRDEGWTFVNRSFPAGLTAAQYETAVETEFGFDAAAILAKYPAADFPSPKHALAQLAGDVEYVCEANRVASLIERTRTPVFLYSFEYEVDPVVVDRVVHGLEVNFVFGNNFGPPLFAPYVLNATDLALFRAISGYWTRFARTGNPNTDDPTVVHWPAFKHPTGAGRGSDKYLTFDLTISEAKRQRETYCDVWEPLFLRSIAGAVPASAP